LFQFGGDEITSFLQKLKYTN